MSVQKTKRRIKIILIVFCVVMAAAAALVIFSNHWIVKVNLRGEREIFLEVGEPFTDPGAEAYSEGSIFKFLRRETPVTVTGKVDTEKVGTYELRYMSSYKDASGERIRRVYVQDTEPPVLTLFGETDSYTLPGQTYVEEGYEAVDNYDGNLTYKVEKEEKNGVLYYSVEDSSGNRTIAERIIAVDDRNAPEITLEGGDLVVPAGEPFEDPGWTAVDDADGDVTERVEVSGTVDTEVEGNYELTYTVKDSYDNEAKVVRTVTVKAMRKEADGQKLVYLTFDGGPNRNTEQLLEILDKYDAKATFFVTNQYPGYHELIKEAYEAGHAIGIHSYSMDFEEIYASDEAFFEDLEKMQAVIEEETGSRTRLLRFAGGSSNTISRNYSEGIMSRLTLKVQQEGYTYFDWNVLSGDAGETTDPKKIAQNIRDGISYYNTSVVLCHDTHAYTVEAIEELLKTVSKQGYTFAALEPDSYSAHHGVNN